MFIIELRFIEIRKSERHLHVRKSNATFRKQIVEYQDIIKRLFHDGLLVHMNFIHLVLKVYRSLDKRVNINHMIG